jgi:fumarylacetoacetate (FAA) hydrolase family protein
LLASDGDRLVNLTAHRPELDGFVSLVRTAVAANRTVDEIAAAHVDEAPELAERPPVGWPVVPPEVWAAGVTYRISEEAREQESDTPEMYLDVYDADRPELFFKASPARTVGPDDPIGIRADSSWNVPEPELGVVVYQESTSTAEMVRTPSELVDWLTRHDATPDLVVLLTGTSLVPPDEFTLSVDDVVRIDVEGIGTLRNPVVEV